ncbi:glycosyltransferase [uncultured Chryseobacterium sp.]|uniref:glycosyltransferase n=1 Tax=uncultured Chryseobacterium sp. TaxID=259322 RepID=UPI0025DF7DCE|nr:glycosyltransferase [uncultured Chryseobacterium sp.]
MNFKKRKIVFILPSLKAGGAERVISYIAARLREDLFEVKLIVLGFKEDTVYDIGSLNTQYLQRSRLINSVVPLFKILFAERPHVVFSTISHVNLAMGFFSIFFKRIKFVGREASVMSQMNQFTNFNSKILKSLTSILYARMTMIVCQSEDMRLDCIRYFGLKSSNLTVINNPITHLPEIVEGHIAKDKIKFITIGRLSKEKGHLRIIDGLKKIKNYDFTYTIIGSGPQEIAIKDQIRISNLENKVSFIPYTSKILEELKNHDYFLQGSFVEGFPNALLESCSVGTPVIAFNAPGGTKEIVENAINGYLVENESDFFEILSKINELSDFRRQDVARTVTSKFNAGRIIKQYEDLLSTI